MTHRKTSSTTVRTLRSLALSLCLVAIATGSVGCTLLRTTYVLEDIDLPAKPRTKKASLPTVEVSVTFVAFNGASNESLSESYAPTAIKATMRSGLFSKAVRKNGDAKVEITIFNDADAGDLGGAILAGALSGCTFGTFGNVTDNKYRVHVSYLPRGAKTPVEGQRHGVVAVGSGLIYSAPEGGREVDDIMDGSRRIVHRAVVATLRKASSLSR